MKPPTYEELCRQFGFKISRDYFRFVSLAYRLAPNDPWEAFEPISIHNLDATRANPQYKDPGHDYADTPIEAFVFAWAGADGFHYAFLVDDLQKPEDEYPIIEVSPSSKSEIIASSFREFLESSVIDAHFFNQEENATPSEAQKGVLKAIKAEFGIDGAGKIKVGTNANGEQCPKRVAEIQERARRTRLTSKEVYPTYDGLGISLPKEMVDSKYLESLIWPVRKPAWKPLPSPDESLLDEAARRLKAGEPGTALIMARNFRTLYWYQDWKTHKRYVTRTAEIMEMSYRALGREHAAKRIRSATDWAIKEVF